MEFWRRSKPFPESMLMNFDSRTKIPENVCGEETVICYKADPNEYEGFICKATGTTQKLCRGSGILDLIVDWQYIKRMMTVYIE